MTHLATLLILTAISVVLWMPFGIGYYEWPWKSSLLRVAIQCFAIGFAVLARAGCISGFWPNVMVGRLAVSFLSLLVALYSVFAMYHWMGAYVRPMLQQNTSTAQISP